MGRPDELVKEMTSSIIVYGVVVQIICVIAAGDLLKTSVGLWIGIATAIGMLRSIQDSAIEALDLGEAGAKKYAQSACMRRYIAVVVVFLIVSFLGIANVLTLLAGVMGLKVSAYLQPIRQKLFKK